VNDPFNIAEQYASTIQVKEHRLRQLAEYERVVNRIRMELVLTSGADVASEVNRLLLHADKATRRAEELEEALREIIAVFDDDRAGYAYDIAKKAIG
jgi:hypothetical protein